MSNKIRIYTDGGGSWKTKRGACAFVALDPGDNILHEFSQKYKNTTTNRMEILAAICGLDWAQAVHPGIRVTLYTDSKYLNGIVGWSEKWRLNGWRNSSDDVVNNLDLVIMYLILVQRIPGYKSKHIPGHAGIYWNEHADGLIRKAKASNDEFLPDYGGPRMLSFNDIAESNLVMSPDLNLVDHYCQREDRKDASFGLGAVPEHKEHLLAGLAPDSH